MDWLIGLWFFFSFFFINDGSIFFLSIWLYSIYLFSFTFGYVYFEKRKKNPNIFNKKIRGYSLSKCSLKCQFLLSCVRRVMIIFSRSVSMCFVHCSIDGFLNNRGWMFVNGFCMFWFCWLCNRSKTNNGYT